MTAEDGWYEDFFAEGCRAAVSGATCCQAHSRVGCASSGVKTGRSKLPMTNIYSPVVDSAAANGGHSHPDDMPHERLARCGVKGLRDDELLTVVLGRGYRGHGVLDVARQILEVHPKEELVTMKLEVLRRLQGVESVKAALLVAAFELVRRGLQKGLGVQPIISRGCTAPVGKDSRRAQGALSPPVPQCAQPGNTQGGDLHRLSVGVDRPSTRSLPGSYRAHVGEHHSRSQPPIR